MPARICFAVFDRVLAPPGVPFVLAEMYERCTIWGKQVQTFRDNPLRRPPLPGRLCISHPSLTASCFFSDSLSVHGEHLGCSRLQVVTLCCLSLTPIRVMCRTV
jgi:hypothetical protein